MLLYFVVFYTAFLISLMSTSLMIKICEKFDIFDYPGDRKIHDNPVPTLGGIPIAVSFIPMIWIGWYLGLGDIPTRMESLLGISLCAVLTVIMGVYDDLRECNVLSKLLFQVIIAIILFYFGFSVEKVTNPFADYFDPSFLKLPITIIWVLLVTNAINLIDGLDGLAGGVVTFSAVTLYLIVSIHGGGLAMYATLILAGSVIGFLVFNFFPAKIFLGDTGSMLLGVITAAVSIVEERKGTVTITLMLPIVIMAFPLIDTALVFFRRLKQGNNPFLGDRGHIHHRLLELGFSQKQVVLVIYAICVYLGVTALALSIASKQFVFWALLILGAGFFIALYILKYFEDKGMKIS